MYRILASFTLTTLVLLITSAQLFAVDAISGNTARKKEQLTVTLDRDMIGAAVHVYYGNKATLLTQTARKRKMIIDFEHASVGEYTIYIEKGAARLTYHYLKK
jgi:hypothetical protein